MTSNTPITGDLSITTADGTVLNARTDLALAWKWARHEHGDQWDSLSRREKIDSAGDALAELRRSYYSAG
jgi:hypothetical protein